MKMRLIVIDDMEVLVEALKRKVVILSALDRDEGWEINAQISTMFNLQTNFEEVLNQSRNILELRHHHYKDVGVRNLSEGKDNGKI